MNDKDVRCVHGCPKHNLCTTRRQTPMSAQQPQTIFTQQAAQPKLFAAPVVTATPNDVCTRQATEHINPIRSSYWQGYLEQRSTQQTSALAGTHRDKKNAFSICQGSKATCTSAATQICQTPSLHTPANSTTATQICHTNTSLTSGNRPLPCKPSAKADSQTAATLRAATRSKGFEDCALKPTLLSFSKTHQHKIFAALPSERRLHTARCQTCMAATHQHSKLPHPHGKSAITQIVFEWLSQIHFIHNKVLNPNQQNIHLALLISHHATYTTHLTPRNLYHSSHTTHITLLLQLHFHTSHPQHPSYQSSHTTHHATTYFPSLIKHHTSHIINFTLFIKQQLVSHHSSRHIHCTLFISHRPFD